jgi:diguanylate cyclase (GGDEF)-like protein/PAS domain S-box-containing protein
VAANRRSPSSGGLDPGDQRWLDTLADAVLILSPVYGRRGRIVDFRVDYANAAASDLDGEQPDVRLGAGFLIGRGFLGLKPAAAAKLPSLFRAVLRTGVPRALDGLLYETTVAGQVRQQVRDVRISGRNDRLLVTFRDVTERRRSEDEVRRREECLRALVDGVADEALVTVDPDGNVASWNTGAESLYGYPSTEIVGRHYSILYPRGWLDGAHSQRANLVAAERRHHDATWQVRKDGTRFWAGVNISAIHGADGGLRGFSAVTRDLTEQADHRRRELQFAVARTLERFSDIDAAADSVLELTTAGLGATLGEMFVGGQPAGRAKAGSWYAFPRQTLEALGAAGSCVALTSWDGLAGRVRTAGVPVTVPDLADICNPVQAAAAAAQGLRSAIACPIVVGDRIVGVLAYFFEVFPGAEGGALESVTEISAEVGQFILRSSAQAALLEEALRMAELASTDRLTGLKNRREFDRMMGTIPRQPYAILAIDVDHLKRVNDEYGHDQGDLVLRTVGTTLSLMLRGWDVVARVGGDEFAAILLDVDAAEAATAAQRLRAAMHLVPGPDDRANISVGWASAPAGADPLSVWKTADECLYTAKREGRDRVVGGHVEEDKQAASAGASGTDLIGDLVAGLPLHAVYQPIVDLNDGHVVGYEALARPHGFGPSDSVEGLFEVAHRSRRIRDLDWLCRRAALSQAAALPDGVPLFINVSVTALLDPLHDVDQMLLLLEWTGRSPEHIVLEIGEHEHVRDLDRLKVVLASYRQAGIRFALDDLGEGFATVELLTAVRAEFIKIARSLTMTSGSTDSRAAIEATLAFAQSSHAVVIAEGVENEFACDQVRLLGISVGQGFGLGRPSVAADVSDTVAAWNTRAAMRPLRPRGGQSRIHMAPAEHPVANAPAQGHDDSPSEDFEQVIYARPVRRSKRPERASTQTAS